MKKIGTGILVMLLGLICFSCGSMPDMEELLHYQQDGAQFQVNITDEELRFSAVITLGETDILELTDSETEGIRFLFGEDEVRLEYDGTSIPISSPERLKAAKWISLFSLSPDMIWKIHRNTIGGIDVYVCVCDNICLYIDAASHLPLKMTDGEVEIDILSCQ